MKKKENLSASESEKIKKARLKLQNRLEKVDRQVTQEALKQKVVEIHHWIARHAHSRIILKNKNISLFDENQNAAKISGKINLLLLDIQKNNFSDSSMKTSNFDLRKRIDLTQRD